MPWGNKKDAGESGFPASIFEMRILMSVHSCGPISATYNITYPENVPPLLNQFIQNLQRASMGVFR